MKRKIDVQRIKQDQLRPTSLPEIFFPPFPWLGENWKEMLTSNIFRSYIERCFGMGRKQKLEWTRLDSRRCFFLTIHSAGSFCQRRVNIWVKPSPEIIFVDYRDYLKVNISTSQVGPSKKTFVVALKKITFLERFGLSFAVKNLENYRGASFRSFVFQDEGNHAILLPLQWLQLP